jgi:hypothetical protein
MTVPDRFWRWADAYYGVSNVDLVDVEALYDSALTYEENVTLFKQFCPVTTIIPKENPNKTATETPTENIHHKKQLDLDTVTFVAIVGDRHTAKSNLLFKHLKEYKGKRKIYLMGYPREVLGFGTISNMQDLVNLRHAVVGMDEMQTFFKLYDKRANEELMEFLAKALHYDVTIIGTTPMTQFITKGVESLVDVWNITRLRDLGSLKNGSKAKRVIQATTHPSCTRWSLSLDNGQYLQFGEALGPEMNGVKVFTDQGIGKEW